MLYKNNNKYLQLNPKEYLDQAQHSIIPALIYLLNLRYMKTVVRDGEEKEENDIKSFNTSMVAETAATSLNFAYTNMQNIILNKMSEFQERDGGWTLEQILFVEVKINQYKPMRRSSYIPLPRYIQQKNACVSVPAMMDIVLSGL